MTRRNVLMISVMVGLVAAVYANRGRMHFNWAAFFLQVRGLSLPHIVAGILLIYGTFWIRAVRWAVFVSPAKRVRARDLVGSHFIGFTAVALFGRLADLTRPYLLARRVELPVSSQVAVYTIERIFDLGSVALIFSTAMAVTPRGLAHHDLFVRVGVGSLVVTVAIAAFAVAVRVAGERVAAGARRVLGRVSPGLGESFATKLLEFRVGLKTLRSVGEFCWVLVLSVTMWGMIALSYYATAHAFVRTPELATLPFSRTMLLVAASIGGGLLTLPVVGWFTQIAAMAVAMQGFFGVPVEAATACAAMLLVVTTLSIVPVGLVFARMEGVSLTPAKVARGREL